MRTSEGTVALLGAYTRELELVFTNENNKKRTGAAAWGGPWGALLSILARTPWGGAGVLLAFLGWS